MISRIDIEIIRNLLVAASEEMATTVIRTSRSTTVRELLDFSTAIFDAEGRNVAQAARMPVHMNSMEPCLRYLLEHYFNARDLAPGDVIGTNDPYSGGQHLPDLLTFRPAFMGGKLIAFAGVLCHHVDIGGGAAGGYNAKAMEIFHEGLRIPPVKLARFVTPDDTSLRFITKNVREPDEYVGDLVAQLSAMDVAVRKIEAIATKYGRRLFEGALDRICEQSSAEVRRILQALPDGKGRFAQFVDGDGQTDEEKTIVATVEKKGTRIAVDLTECSGQSQGPVNATLSSTLSACYFALSAVLAPKVPVNAGAFCHFDVVTRPGSIVDCQPPVPVVSRMLVCHKVIMAIWGALAEIYPAMVPAAYYGSSYPYSHAFPVERGVRVYFDSEVGGWGATARNDGVSGYAAGFHNAANTPIEVVEATYPVQFACYELRRGSGGSGRHAGGDGIRRSWVVAADGVFSANMDGFKHGAYGLAGAKSGEPARLYVDRAGQRIMLSSKLANFPIKRNDRITLETAGGGGWGQ